VRVKARESIDRDSDSRGRPVLVKEKCSPANVDELHDKLTEVDAKYTKDIHLATQWKDIPDLKKLYDTHVVTTPYSLSIQKCGSEDCRICKPIRCPDVDGLRELVMERQPTPRADPNRRQHFLRRDEALALFREQGSKPQDLVDLSALPSAQVSEAASAKKERKDRDLEVTKKMKLQSWSASKVRALVTCWLCGKPRCLYSTRELSVDSLEVLPQLLEAAHFVCGALLCQPDEPMGQEIAQKIDLNCKSAVEKSYFNPDSGRVYSLWAKRGTAVSGRDDGSIPYQGEIGLSYLPGMCC
jgi:hypothetical protein